MKHKLLSILLCLAMALSLLPTAALAEGAGTTGTIKVNTDDTSYLTLEEAVNAATEAVNGVLTYTITGKVSTTTTDQWIGFIKGGFTGVTKVCFVGEGADAELCISNSQSILGVQGIDVEVSFENLLLSHPNGAWVNDLGNTTNYFACMVRNSNHTVTYTNCTFPNGASNNMYGETVFNGCEFTSTTGWSLWHTSQGTSKLSDCTFTGKRGVKLYTEGTYGTVGSVELKDTTFNLSDAEKAAVEITKPGSVSMDNVSVSGTTAGAIKMNLTDGYSSLDKATVAATGSKISGDFTARVEESKAGENIAVEAFGITDGEFTALESFTLEALKNYLAPGATINENGTVEMNPVAKVGTGRYTTLEAAFAALDSTDYKLELLGEESVQKAVWPENTPVYWKAGDQSDYAATLKAALKAAYMANKGDITIICRPGADVGEMTHGHVADNLTIYGNNAYLSDGECDLEVDEYKFSRTTGEKDETNGEYLTKDITITAYELDNLGVWGTRHTDKKVTINLTDCDGKAITGKTNVQRVYINGTTGVNDITLTGCDFLTKATAVYSNADGEVMIDNCSFTGGQVPVNFNHKANGTQTVKVKNSTFTNCGSTSTENKLNQYAAPVRFVNSGNGTMSANVDACTITGTVGSNGDILIGDGRTGKESKDVTLTVSGTAANVQAQQSGYYNGEDTVDNKKGSKNVAASDTFTSSIEEMVPKGMADYVVVGGIAGFENTKFASFADAYTAIKPKLEKLCASDALGQGAADVAKFDALFTNRDTNGNATLTYTITGNVTYDETGYANLLTMGRRASHYSNGRHLINFKFVGGSNDKTKDTLTVNSNITLPYEWWGEKTTTSISFENLTITGSAPSGLYPSQPYFESIDFTVNNCMLKGIKIYNCSNVGGSYTITNSTLDGTGAPKNAYAIHLQGHETAPLTINISNNTISGYDRGINIDQKTANATISSNTISVNDTNRSCIQLTQLATTTVSGNTLNLTGGNALTFHSQLAESSKINFTGNTVNGTGYLIYDDTKNPIELTYSSNTAASTVDTTKGIYRGNTKELTKDVDAVINPAPSYSGGSSSYDPTYSVSTPSKTEHGTVTVSPKNASKGDTVTVTVKPDSGYVLETLTVTDKNGNELTLKDKGNGKYTFTMPAGKVEVKATFMEDNSMLNFFYDVPNGAYFYEAVKWAVENGITTGVGNDLFAPEQPCTRAQIVTFLWRAAGSPEPKGTAAGMTDVVSGSYYAKAVAWAIENGVTTGTTATTFSPDATCTRAQAVTFLARALNAKAASAAEFSDVPTDSYFVDAVAWAAANGVTEGIGGGLFAPDNDCTRGQIVTFLYRAYNK